MTNLYTQYRADDITDEAKWDRSIVQTKAGYVICDSHNKRVYFTDTEGHVVRVSTDWEEPVCAAVTSWGHVLIADYCGHEIIEVFSEVGAYLGRLQDNGRQMIYPHYIHIDEEEGLLYVACGLVGARKLCKYKLTAGEVPLLPITCFVTKMTMTPITWLTCIIIIIIIIIIK